MYHCFVRSSVIVSLLIAVRCIRSTQGCSLRPEESQNGAERPVEHQVDAPEVDAHGHREEDHDERRRIDLLAAGPRDAAHLVADFGQEAARTPPPSGDALSRASAY